MPYDEEPLLRNTDGEDCGLTVFLNTDDESQYLAQTTRARDRLEYFIHVFL